MHLISQCMLGAMLTNRFGKITYIHFDYLKMRIFYVIISVLLVFLLYDTLKMVTRVTETCRRNK
jgi:dolichyl-phosphate-mannose--protein O-mannosyl transferase